MWSLHYSWALEMRTDQIRHLISHLKHPLLYVVENVFSKSHNTLWNSSTPTLRPLCTVYSHGGLIQAGQSKLGHATSNPLWKVTFSHALYFSYYKPITETSMKLLYNSCVSKEISPSMLGLFLQSQNRDSTFCSPLLVQPSRGGRNNMRT